MSVSTWIIDGYPPAVFRHNEVLARNAEGFYLLGVPGVDRPRWFHPANVFAHEVDARRELANRIGMAAMTNERRSAER